VNRRILDLYKTLLRQYGPPAGQWLLWCKRPKMVEEREEIVMGSVLTQRTNWKNVELAFDRLRSRGLFSLASIADFGEKSPQELANIVRPSGFYQTKSRYLTEVARFFVKAGGVPAVMGEPLPAVRRGLLDLRGVGCETADDILLYALDKPVFVIDGYTRRLIKRHRLARKLEYEHLRRLFESSLPHDYGIYQDFHALIVIDGKSNSQ
jgi:endonuclease-3 related protein